MSNQIIRDSSKFPTAVPVLAGEDFCQGNYHLKNETCCMIGWFRQTFCSEYEAVGNAEQESRNKGNFQDGISLREKYDNFGAQALQAIMIEAKRVDKDTILSSFNNNYGRYFPGEVIEFNDHDGRKLDTLARVWNRAMTRLGYVEGNPEA